jgi:glycine betaine catabolism B
MEWTLPHQNPDIRGNRRYFTIASSPTEDTIRLGIKFYQNGSSFKNALKVVDANSILVGGQLGGDFTLPKDTSKKLAFLAGGIGITPFRSMVKYLVDTREKRDVVLLYSNKVSSEIMYADVFDQGVKQAGLKTVYTLTDPNFLPSGWKGRVGRVDQKMVEAEIPDWKERTFYLSGPHVMVTAFETILKEMGLPQRQIKIDFFPGFV